MKLTSIAAFSFAALIASVTAAEAPSFAGEYADRNFMNGRAVFQMSLEQSGNSVSVWLSAGYNDGHGCSVDAQGIGKVTGKGALEFTFRDSSSNAGGGTITRAGDALAVSIRVTRAADARCLEFYRQSIRLKKTK
jgi:hypothetical protein